MEVTAQTLTCWILALMFGAAGILHFTALREDYARMIPPILPYPMAIVYLTGVMEIAGAIGLLIPAARQVTGILMILFLIAVFPANIYGSLKRLPFRSRHHPSIWIRLPLQILLIALLWWSTQ